MEPMYIGFSLVCDCYDPSPEYSGGPMNSYHMETAATKDEVIEDWNENWGTQ